MVTVIKKKKKNKKETLPISNNRIYRSINNNSKGEIDLNCFFMNGSMFDINSMFSSSRAKNLKKIYFISQ